MTFRTNAYRPAELPEMPAALRRARHWLAAGAVFEVIGGTVLIVYGHQPVNGVILGFAAAGLLVMRRIMRWGFR